MAGLSHKTKSRRLENAIGLARRVTNSRGGVEFAFRNTGFYVAKCS